MNARTTMIAPITAPMIAALTWLLFMVTITSTGGELLFPKKNKPVFLYSVFLYFVISTYFLLIDYV